MKKKIKAQYLNIKSRIFFAYATIFGKVRFKDKYGLKYYLWKDTRLRSSVFQEIRSDDTGVIIQVFDILRELQKRKQNLVCFDVGAFMGVITLAMASRLGPHDKVFSFEPTWPTYSKLLDNISLNKYKIVTPKNLALSNSSKEAIINITKDPGQSYMLPEDQVAKDWLVPDNSNYQEIVDTQEISVDTIDEFTKREKLHHIDILKIDAEGQDLNVLRGSNKLLKSKTINYIICEIEDAAANEAIMSLLGSYDYDLFYIVRNGEFLVKDLNDYPYQSYKKPLNVLAISPKAPAFVNGQGLNIQQ